ncbi:hypothetical protein Tco_0895852, partial [Tanacetum coccineum]
MSSGKVAWDISSTKNRSGFTEVDETEGARLSRDRAKTEPRTSQRWDPGYKKWIHHGEPNLPPPPPAIDNTRQPQMSDMIALLNDLSYIPPNNEQNEPTQGDIGETSNEPLKQIHTAKEMTWHATGKRMEPDKMQHPVDGRAWMNFDTKYPNFAKEPRNVRLGLATDGFNPFGNLSRAYNMWPVILTTYNLPPWLCMKKSYFILTLLISGPKSPGKNIDVYLRPLIDDLKVLWALNSFENIDVAIFGQHRQGKTRLEKVGHSKWLVAWPNKNGKCSKPQAVYSFIPENRKKFCQFVKGVKLPDWFGYNFKHKVTNNDTNITGVKSHDCHIMMQHLLPYGLQQYLPDEVAKPIIELCSFFKQICFATLMQDDMLKAQSKVVDILGSEAGLFATSVMFHLKDSLKKAKRKPHWKVVEHVNHKKFSDGGVIVVEEDLDVIHFDNSSDLPLSTSLNDLDNATLHIYGQSTEVDAPSDIIDLDEDGDIIDDEDALPHDLADSDDEDLVNVDDDDDGVDVMSADVARGHGSDDGSDDRPPTHHIPTGCEGCFVNRGKGTRKPNLGGRKAGRLHTRQETQNLGLKKITDDKGSVLIRFEWDDKKTMMPLGDHASHWSNYLGELIREMPLYYPSWQKVLAERKAAIVTRLGLPFGMIPETKPEPLKISKTGQRARLYADRSSNHPFVYSSHNPDLNEVSISLVIGETTRMSADVARGHDGDGGGDDRPPPHHIPTGCGGCFANQDIHCGASTAPAKVVQYNKASLKGSAMVNNRRDTRDVRRESSKPGNIRTIREAKLTFGMIPGTKPEPLNIAKNGQRAQSYAGRDPGHLLAFEIRWLELGWKGSSLLPTGKDQQARVSQLTKQEVLMLKMGCCHPWIVDKPRTSFREVAYVYQREVVVSQAIAKKPSKFNRVFTFDKMKKIGFIRCEIAEASGQPTPMGQKNNTKMGKKKGLFDYEYDIFVDVSRPIMQGRNHVQQKEVVREVLLSMLPPGAPDQDKHSRKGLQAMVQKRKKLLNIGAGEKHRLIHMTMKYVKVAI